MHAWWASGGMRRRTCSTGSMYACTDICTNARWLYHAGGRGLFMWVYICLRVHDGGTLGVRPEPRTVESLGLLHWMAVWWLTVSGGAWRSVES